MEKREAIGYLKGIDTESRMGSLDYEYLASKKIVIEILQDADVHTLDDLILEIESRVKTIVDKKYPDNDIYFYFNCLDSQFDGNHEKALALADKLWK